MAFWKYRKEYTNIYRRLLFTCSSVANASSVQSMTETAGQLKAWGGRLMQLEDELSARDIAMFRAVVHAEQMEPDKSNIETDKSTDEEIC